MISLTKFTFSIFAVIAIISCKDYVDDLNYKCDVKPNSPIWGQWKEVSFQKKLLNYKNFEKDWTISTNQENFNINACSDVTEEQRKNMGCCGFLYYELKNDTLFAGGFGGGKGCESVYCIVINGKLIIEKLTPDSLTIINDYGRFKYLKIK